MPITNESLSPTFWRTCRVLANERRLKCLKTVLKAPGSTVGEVAGLTGLPECQASTGLRLLQSRGLLEVEREGVHIRYYPIPDPLVRSAKPILLALQKALITRKMSLPAIVEELRAFRHECRLRILDLLSDRRRGADELQVLLRISHTGVLRHIHVLEELHHIQHLVTDEYELRTPAVALAAELQLALLHRHSPK